MSIIGGSHDVGMTAASGIKRSGAGVWGIYTSGTTVCASPNGRQHPTTQRQSATVSRRYFFQAAQAATNPECQLYLLDRTANLQDSGGHLAVCQS